MKKTYPAIILRFLFFSFLLSGATGNRVFSQHNKINFPLRLLLNQPEKQNQAVHLAVKGDAEKIKSALREYEGVFKYSFNPPAVNAKEGTGREISFITLPAKNIDAFSRNDFVEKIEFYGGKPVALNDTLKINMNAIPVHEGLQPLLQSYDGTGVLIGVIDLGIELDHPDFKDSLGRTRVVSLWDQTLDTSSLFFDPLRVPLPYGYGQVWDSSDINGGFHHHTEQSYGHGSHVAGIAAGNGKADSVPLFSGMAPNANLIIVSSDFDANDWLQTVADAVDFIFDKAEAMNKPCVINISAGTYSGSHDGKDFAAQYINNLVAAMSGRAVVCAAGNGGTAPLFHLRTSIASDSKFTWFKKNDSLIDTIYAPDGAVYFEVFSDTADFNNVLFSFGADKTSPYELRGTSNFFNIKNLFDSTYTPDTNGIFSDTLKNSMGQTIAKIYFAADLINNDETYALYVLLNPDSGQYNYRFTTSGTGMFDVWSAKWIGLSDMVYDSLPSFPVFPDIADYSVPDNKQTIVSSFTCAPNVITVGNYTNRQSYISYFGNEVFANNDTVPPLVKPGTLFPTSSKGPTRDGRTKPDITAPGGPVLSAGKLPILNALKSNQNDQLAQGGMHFENSGTSMSSPAVAGLAALYFQKCPNAGINDFYYALTQNARTDSSTGAVPNNSWGYGKADAFETLTSSNFTVSLSNPDSIACPGAVVLTVNGSFPFYQWSNGVSGAGNTVYQSGNYYATVTNQKGCKGRTDTVKVFINDSLPSPTLVVTGDPFFCEGDSVQLSYPDTFLSYLWNNGAAANSIYAEETDFYRVTATANNGCRFTSDSVLVWAKPNPTGPAISQNGDTLSSTPANAYQWYLNGAALPGETNQDNTVSQSGYYQVEVFHINGCSAISDSAYVVKTGEEKLSVQSSGFRIYPNPGDGKFTIQIFNAQPSMYYLEILSPIGKSVFQSEFSGLLYKIDLSSFQPGIYPVILRTASEQRIIKLVLMK